MGASSLGMQLAKQTILTLGLENEKFSEVECYGSQRIKP